MVAHHLNESDFHLFEFRELFSLILETTMNNVKFTLRNV